jgi:cyclase
MEGCVMKARGFKNPALFLLFILAGVGYCLAQQQPLTVQKIRGGIYMVKGGSGANTGFYIGDTEVLIIDAKMTVESTKQIIEEVRKLTAKPITRIILTHSDGDHVNGLNGLPAGLKIYAHPQTKKDLEEASKSPDTPYLREYLPNEVCSPCAASKESSMNLRMGAELLQLYYFGPAHTSGDLVVYFPAEKVAFVGDLTFVGRDPLIHRQKGGSSLGLMETLQSLLSLDADTFISGHSDPLTRQDIQGIYASLAEKRDKVKAMIDEGKSLDEIKKAFGIQDAQVQPGRPRFPGLVEVIYLDLTEKK